MLAPYNIIFEELVPFELEMQFNWSLLLNQVLFSPITATTMIPLIYLFLWLYTANYDLLCR